MFIIIMQLKHTSTLSLKNRCLLPLLILVAAYHHSDGFLQLSCRGKHIVKNHGSISTQFYYQRQLDAAMINNTKDDTSQTDIGSTNKLPFNPWPHQVVECHGDYREEAYLENIIGGQLYDNQKSLPNLPVPTLKHTIERFIPSALPLCESDGERQSLIEACDKFEEQAKDLQIRLLQRKEESEKDSSSWLQKWWNQLGYLRVRDPVAVHVSYFLSIDDDPTLPTVEDIQKDELCGATKPDVLRGACAIFAAARVRRRVCSGQLACDKAGKKPLCSTGYKYLFNACRIPSQESDKVKLYDPSSVKHCIVASRGYFFAVDFVDDQANPLPLESLIKRLLKCQEMAKEQESLGVPKAVGWLSGCSRHFWAEARDKLTKYNSFDKAMKVLESGAFVLCLDETIPKTTSDASEVFWNGKGTLGCNRFFDKSVQIVVDGLGQAALVGEHSMMDGSIPMVIIHQIQRDKYSRLLRASHRLPSHDTNVGQGVSDIFSECWNDQELTRLTKELGELGCQQYQNLTDSVELKTILHEDYGKQYIKKGKVSPDAFLQLVFQLTAYRCFGKQIATYEATQTRQFIHGRTETARTVSVDSKAFVEAMGLKYMADRDDILAKKEKLKLLRQAAAYHHNLTLDACGGMGVDRHFLGLSLVRKDGEQAPDLFKDPIFERSKTWRLSTSGLPTTPGFGPVVEDGLGVGYGLHSNSCLFHISSRKENKYVDRFCHELVLALKEMKGLLEADDDGITAQ